MGSFIWNNLSFIITVALAVFIAHDVNKHGSFNASKTGVFLKDVGALKYGELAVARARSYSQQAYRWGQKHMPVYISQTRESLSPLVVAARNLVTRVTLQVWNNLTLLYQYIQDKTPQVGKWANHYVPGLTDTAGKAWDQMKDYARQLAALLVKCLSSAAQWLRDNIFVGKLSPENLQKVTMEALNTTHTLALQTFSWINSKMVTVSAT